MALITFLLCRHTPGSCDNSIQWLNFSLHIHLLCGILISFGFLLLIIVLVWPG